MARPTPPPYARRFRAALDLRGWTVAELADEIPPAYSLSKSTLDKISAGQRPPRDYEYPLFAEKLEVPEWFLRSGFEAVSPEAEGDGELEQLRAFVREIADTLERLERGALEPRPRQSRVRGRTA